MSTDLREEMMKIVPVTDEPEIRARQRHVAKIIIDMNPDMREEWVQEGYDKGVTQGKTQGLAQGAQLVRHLYERRLGRPLTEEERLALPERTARLGPDRMSNVLLDLSPDALAAWLADPNAT